MKFSGNITTDAAADSLSMNRETQEKRSIVNEINSQPSDRTRPLVGYVRVGETISFCSL
jgi:hypothetical protein